MISRRCRFVGIAALLLATAVFPARAAEVKAAVAANFAGTLEALREGFERASGDGLVLSSGSTGKFYAQIQHGAPFDVFLAADDEHPRRLEAAGLAMPGSRFTYAFGRLALWSPEPGRIDADGAILKHGDFPRLAVANPRLAPYGTAAVQALKRLGVWGRWEKRLVYGENIAQTFQFVATGNAALGFVALAQLKTPAGKAGSYWLVPQELHEPLHQDAVLLARGADNPAAARLLAYLRSPEARRRIAEDGYGLPD